MAINLSRMLSVALLTAAAGAVLLACGGATPPPATPEAPAAPGAAEPATPSAPAISHDLAGKDDCGSCHKVGEGAKPLSESHKGRDNATCKGCHQPKAG